MELRNARFINSQNLGNLSHGSALLMVERDDLAVTLLQSGKGAI
jgi:hypothetical protein